VLQSLKPSTYQPHGTSSYFEGFMDSCGAKHILYLARKLNVEGAQCLIGSFPSLKTQSTKSESRTIRSDSHIPQRPTSNSWMPSRRSKSPSDPLQLAHSSCMWELSAQLIGSIGLFNDTSRAPNTQTDYLAISSNIENIALLGSSDLN
jgi:hypothetical protein